jgi:hypothetical protein
MQNESEIVAHPFTMLVLNTRYSQVHTLALRESTTGQERGKSFLTNAGLCGRMWHGGNVSKVTTPENYCSMTLFCGGPSMS